MQLLILALSCAFCRWLHNHCVVGFSIPVVGTSGPTGHQRRNRCESWTGPSLAYPNSESTPTEFSDYGFDDLMAAYARCAVVELEINFIGCIERRHRRNRTFKIQSSLGGSTRAENQWLATRRFANLLRLGTPDTTAQR
ncbi:hypothetical protein DFH06DRAFT_1148352 [Mycena polygramma]|nr:hypothetical protein DFH06DRAFT_1148352 [Mycena polygramma]